MSTTGQDAGLFNPCARHQDAAAVYRCCECGEYLCSECVEIGSHLIFCGLCGERAIELDELESPGRSPGGVVQPSPPARPGFDRGAPRRVGSFGTAATSSSPSGQRVAPARDVEAVETDVTVLAVNHVVVPAATITMVAALLFFLLDVRSVFLYGTEALKWVGFWFVMATVLIARYGRTSHNAERQGCYTFALAAATLTVMTVSPWANPTGSLPGTLANFLIILAVWRYASRLTRGLSFEGRRARKPEARLYGVERLRMEQWRQEHGEKPGEARSTRPATVESPGAPVARLAAAGILAFALGEPFLLAGPPAAGERALGAMIVFLLAAGVVLAAGSGLGTLRRVRALGGQASLGSVPGRIATAGLAMIALLALALAMPGLEVRGTGALRPSTPDEGVEAGGTETEDQRATGDETGERKESADQRRETEGRQQAEDQRRDSNQSREPPRGFSKAASSLVGMLAELGRWLRYVVLFLGALLALWGLWRLLPHLGGLRRGLTAGLGRFFRRLLAGLRGVFRRRRAGGSPARRGDPFTDLESLRRLEPREAVLAAYGRLLLAFELLDHARPERHTPYEFLASMPSTLRDYAGPARSLTDVYVRVAYGGGLAGDDDRFSALAALDEIEKLISDQERPG